MKFYLVLIILSIIKSSEDIETEADEPQRKLTMYDEDVESQSSSLNQSVESLNGLFEEYGLDPLEQEITNLISKESRNHKYLKFNEDNDDPVIFSRKVELNSREYPWLKKLQKLLILDKKMNFYSQELQSFLNKNVWLEKLLSSGNNNKDDVSSQTIKIVNAKPVDSPAFSTSPNNTKDLLFNNMAEKAKSSVDKPPNQLESLQNLDRPVVLDAQQVSLKAPTPSIKNKPVTSLPQKPNLDSSNIQIFVESSITQPESGESASLSQNSSTGLYVTPTLSEQTRHNVFSKETEQPFNEPGQGFGINTNSTDPSKKHFENLKSDLLSQRLPISTDKITKHSRTSITNTLTKERKLNELQSKPDKTLMLSKTNFEVEGEKSRRANSIKGENETYTFRKNGDPVKLKDKKKEKKVKKKSRSKKKHKKKVDNLKETKTKKKSKKRVRRKKKIASVKKKDEHDTLNLKMGDDPNIYSLFENIYGPNTSKHLNGNAKNVSPNYFRYLPAIEKNFIFDDNMINFEEDERLKALEPNNVFYKSNYSSPLDDTEAQKSTQNNYVKPQYDKTKVVDRRYLPDKGSFHKDKSQDYNSRTVGSAFQKHKSSAIDIKQNLVFNNGIQLKSDGSSQNIAFQNLLILKFTVRRKRL
jgi:hypothetical protein